MDHINNDPYQLLKKDVQDENNNATNSTMFSSYIKNVLIDDDEIMVSFDVTSLYTNIFIIDTLYIIKDYVNNDDQFTRKTAIPQNKFLDLVHLVLTTTWYTFILSFTNKLMVLSWEIQHLRPQQKFICRLMNPLHPPKVWEGFVDELYFIVKRTHLEKMFHHISNFHQNFMFTMEEESNGSLAFLDTLLKWYNGEIPVFVYRKSTHTDQYLHYSSYQQTSCKESVVSSLFNRA